MNDSYVSKCSQEAAMGQNAYILFYEKIIQDKLDEKESKIIEEKTKQIGVVVMDNKKI